MVDLAEVKIWGEYAGAIPWDENLQLGFFQYHKEYIKNGSDLAPIKMPLRNGNRIYSFPELRTDKKKRRRHV